MFAFVLNHFGSNNKYLELELYFIMNLKKYTKYDIVYLYSINDTPTIFVNIFKNICNKVVSYDDNDITYNIKFNSSYKHFNILRTSNYLFAYKLTEYKKICIIESDMIVLKNIDNIFNLNTPSILINTDLNLKNNQNILDNFKITNKNVDFNSLDTNGGIMLLTPSLQKYNQCIETIKFIIDNNFIFPNESLFLHTNKTIYNIPYKYNINAKEYDIKNHINKYKIKNFKNYAVLLHFKITTYKHIDIIRDNYLEKMKYTKPILYDLIYKYYNEIYVRCKINIDNIIKSIETNK
jgi:hypothetical protein